MAKKSTTEENTTKDQSNGAGNMRGRREEPEIKTESPP